MIRTDFTRTMAELDVSGLLCPLPVLKTRKALAGMEPGSVLRVTATDPAAVIDIPHFCNEAGHKLLGQDAEEGRFHFEIERG